MKTFPQFISSFPNEVSRSITDDQANLFCNIITQSASSFFGATERSKKENKGWWSKDVKKKLEMTLRILTIDTKKAVTCQPKCSSQTQRDSKT